MANVTINSLPTASTIDATNDLLPIYTNSLTATQAISRNTYLNLSSQPVGLTDSQTLTNKTLTSPTINGATLSGTLSGTYTIGGTPTFPATVVQTTTSQTLTNKTLTSPTINSPTITNATISADTLTGYTTSNSGTIYGVGVTTGQISGSNTVLPAALATGIPTNKFSNPYKFRYYSTASQNTGNNAFAQVLFATKDYDTSNNFASSTFTAPIAGFYYFFSRIHVTVSSSRLIISIFKGSTEIIRGTDLSGTFSSGSGVNVSGLIQLAAGDTVTAQSYGSAALAIDNTAGNASVHFGGFLLSAT